MVQKRDPNLDTLLYLNGVSYAIENHTAPYWVKFVVKQVPVSPERPHGLHYSLTLHNAEGERIIGFDNAHPVKEGSGPGATTRIEYDHKHRREIVRHYVYQDAATLLADFWKEVERILEERGIKA